VLRRSERRGCNVFRCHIQQCKGPQTFDVAVRCRTYAERIRVYGRAPAGSSGDPDNGIP
jgi:hypothetical protein